MSTENGKTEKGKCNVCGRSQAAKREMAKEAEKKQEAAQTPARKENPAEVHKGTSFTKGEGRHVHLSGCKSCKCASRASRKCAIFG
jgi:hypothetical protein